MYGKQTSATLVLVTDQFACERIIKASRLVADLNKTDELLVLNVMKPDSCANPKALEHLFGVAKEYGALMTIQFSDSVESAIIHCIRENHVVCAVTGQPESANSVLVRLWERLPNVLFYTVGPKGTLREALPDTIPLLPHAPRKRNIRAGERG